MFTLRRFLFFISAFSFFLAASIFFFSRDFTMTESYSFVISDIPHHTVYANSRSLEGVTTRFNSPAANVTLSVLEYWQLDREFKNSIPFVSLGATYTLFDIQEFLSKIPNFESRVEILRASDLKNYLNTRSATPLIAQVPFSFEGAQVPSVSIVVGVDERNENIIVENYWLGDNYKVSFEDLRKNKFFDDDNRGVFLIFHPDNEKVAKVPAGKFFFDEEGNELRKSQARHLLVPYATALSLLLIDPTPDRSISIMKRIVGDPSFTSGLHPFFQIGILNALTQALLLEKRIPEARIYAERSISLNHNLTDAHGVWPGLPSTPERLAFPYFTLANVALAENKVDEAVRAFQEVLKIDPTNVQAADRLHDFQ